MNFTQKNRKILFLIGDVILISLSVWLAFLLRFEGQISGQYFPILKSLIILALVFCLPIFYFFSLYFFSWSYVSARELISLIEAATLSFFLIAISIFVLKGFSFLGFPRSVLFMSYFLVILFSGGIRFSKRVFLQIFQERAKEGFERTLIVGAGDAGEQILRSILSSSSNLFQPIGFVDDNLAKQGLTIHGLKVLGKIEDIPRVIKENQVEGMIIALPSAGSATIRQAVERGRKAGLKKIKVIPSIAEIINGQVSIHSLREIQVEDLLGREPVSLDERAIKNFISDKKILVTGGAGSIGSELCRQIAKFNPGWLLILDQDETGIFNILNDLEFKFPKLKVFSAICDILDEEKIKRIFAKSSPQIVFHAAAYKHVPLMEEHYDEAVKNNIFGTKIVAEVAIKQGVEKFIFVSTDKSVNPTSVMGATKRVGEMICQILNGRNLTKFISVRFGNVLDSRGSVIPLFKEQIKRGGPVEITHPEMKRYFMSNPEACLLVMQAGEMGQGGEVFVLDMGEPIKIIDLAKEMIRLSGFEPDKDIPFVFTKPRPGEKIFEEVLSAEEGTRATQHQKIFITRPSDISEEKLNSCLGKLKEASAISDKETIIKTLKELIPSYQPAIPHQSRQ